MEQPLKSVTGKAGAEAEVKQQPEPPQQQPQQSSQKKTQKPPNAAAAAPKTKKKQKCAITTKLTGKSAMLSANRTAPQRKRSSHMLDLVSQMYREHASLFQKHASILERVANAPDDPSSWRLCDKNEENPAVVQQQLRQRTMVSLAVQSYEGMVDIQKRVDYVERLLLEKEPSKRKGIKGDRGRTTGKKRKPSPLLPPENGKELFFRENRLHFTEMYKTKNFATRMMTKEWEFLSPLERQTYEQTARALRQELQEQEFNDDNNGGGGGGGNVDNDRDNGSRKGEKSKRAKTEKTNTKTKKLESLEETGVSQKGIKVSSSSSSSSGGSGSGSGSGSSSSDESSENDSKVGASSTKDQPSTAAAAVAASDGKGPPQKKLKNNVSEKSNVQKTSGAKEHKDENYMDYYNDVIRNVEHNNNNNKNEIPVHEMVGILRMFARMFREQACLMIRQATALEQQSVTLIHNAHPPPLVMGPRPNHFPPPVLLPFLGGGGGGGSFGNAERTQTHFLSLMRKTCQTMLETQERLDRNEWKVMQLQPRKKKKKKPEQPKQSENEGVEQAEQEHESNNK